MIVLKNASVGTVSVIQQKAMKQQFREDLKIGLIEKYGRQYVYVFNDIDIESDVMLGKTRRVAFAKYCSLMERRKNYG